MKLCAIIALSCAITATAITPEEFATPPASYRPVPLWFWNNTTIEQDKALEQISSFTTADGYGGCAVLPFGRSFAPEYLSEDYFKIYGSIVDYAKKNGLTMSLYDEFGFPSGSMGAINGDDTPRFMQRHPGATIKRLDKHEFPLQNGNENILKLPEDGKIMSVVAMDMDSKRIIPLTDSIKDGVLRYTTPGNGSWKALCFTCVIDGDPNVDYLDPDAVALFIEETHQRYYDHSPEAFGTVITETFCDEPTLYRAQGRIWTDSFNDRFEEEYGYKPDALYPALWYDIGTGTPAARNALFGLRAQMYSEGFMKTIHEWAKAHGIRSTGHQDQEEVLNPVSVAGDLMLCGKHMDIPGIDKIGGDRPAELFYKVVSSSAANWDKELVMSETFGAMGNISIEQMYAIAMDQYTKGINQLIPHAVWYNDTDVTFLPELSWRNPLYNSELPEFNLFLSRLNYMLRPAGRTVADIAVLYPINTLQAAHYLDGPEGFYAGGVKVPQTDYIHVASILSDSICHDFTYLHPSVLDDCKVGKASLNLNNKVNHQHYKVLILPGVRCIAPSTLNKIENFQKKGGKVIFTTALPDQSATAGTSGKDIAAKVGKMLTHKKNPAVFIENPTSQSIEAALYGCSFTPDVIAIEGSPVKYIHRIVGKKHIYYFANPGTKDIDSTIRLRDQGALTLYDPHTGLSHPIEQQRDGSIQISLAANKSAFIVSE